LKLKDPAIWSRPTDSRSTTTIFDHDGVFEIQSWALINGSTPGSFLPRTILFTPERGCSILPPPTGERWLLRGYGWYESLIDGLRCYCGMYLYRLGGGWLHDGSNMVLIYYNHTYTLGITNSNSNLLHDRSNLVLISYNIILSIRNSNKLNSRIGNNDAGSGKWNKK
jgi:hypothetical protein